MTDKDLQNIAIKIEPVFKRYDIAYAGIFGSYARGEENSQSDVDILIKKGKKSLSLFDFMDIKDEISKILGKKVDLLSEKAVIPHFKDYIFKDLKTIYEER